MAEPRRELTRTLLGVIFLTALIVASLWILRPFLGAAIWATMIVVATWPVMLWFHARLWNRRALAVAVMTLILLLLFVVPFTLAVSTLVLNADEIAVRLKALAAFRMPTPPGWVAELPFVGAKVVLAWEQAAAAGVEGLLTKLMPYAGSVTRWFVAEAGNAGFLFVQFMLTLVLAAVMFAKGEAAALAVTLAAQGLFGHVSMAHRQARRFGAWRSASSSLLWCRPSSAAWAWRSPECRSPASSPRACSFSASRRSGHRRCWCRW